MKKLSSMMFLFLVAGLFMATGCTQDKELIMKTANALYLDIKTVVTDPEIRPMIPDDSMAKLANLERDYLVAVDELKTAEEGQGPLATIASCADDILIIIDELATGGKYQKTIAAIRVSVNLLKNHIL